MHRPLNCPLSYFGYRLERAEYHGIGSHDETIAAFEDMLTKVDNAPRTAALNAVFVWYHYSVLTIVYYSDVPPSPKPGALARSEGNKRG